MFNFFVLQTDSSTLVFLSMATYVKSFFFIFLFKARTFFLFSELCLKGSLSLFSDSCHRRKINPLGDFGLECP